MDATRFDALTRMLSTAGSRRSALAGLLAGALGRLGRQHVEEAAAHNTLKKCKKLKDKKKKKACLKKAKKHKAQHAAEDGSRSNQGGTTSGGGGGVGDTPECTTPEQCDDGVACTDDMCDTNGTCVHAVNDSLCTASDPCLAGRCDPAAATDASGCVFPDCCPGATEVCYSGPAGTEGVGVCQAGSKECQSDGTWGPCVGEITPSSEVCNFKDDDCDGVVDDGAPCPTGQRCENGGCCKVDGFGVEHECTSNTECCSGNCATHKYGTTCRPEGCVPSGTTCDTSTDCTANDCCSLTVESGKCA